MTSETRPDPIDPDGSATPGRSAGDDLGTNTAPNDDALHPDDFRERQPAEGNRVDPDESDGDLDADEVVEDAVEYFTEEGDNDSPASDSDAPAPG